MRRAPVCAVTLAAVLVHGCGDAARDGEPPPAAAALPEVATPELEPIPRPDLSPLKQTVQEQVEQELVELEAFLADPATRPAELAERFGRLARVYHAYGLLDPADVAYRNAARL
ncbi:MAG: hypothetical protein ACE5EG_11505, partial [Thermoanaerobaculia bacterium]